MKNKKIIPLTIFIVAAVLAGVFGLSRFFETTWQQSEQVDNNLNAEILEDSETKINYPYNVVEGNIDIPEGAISYQEAANIAGDALLYLSGVTEHQKIAGDIHLYKKRMTIVNNKSEVEETGEIIKERYDYSEYCYNLQIDLDLSDETCPKYIRLGCGIDSLTGKINWIDIEDYSKYGQDYAKIEEEFMPKTWQRRELNKTEIGNNLDYINQIIGVLGWDCKPVFYNMGETTNPYGVVYEIEILMDNGEAYSFMICSEDGNLEKDSLIHVIRCPYVPENLTPIS